MVRETEMGKQLQFKVAQMRALAGGQGLGEGALLCSPTFPALAEAGRDTCGEGRETGRSTICHLAVVVGPRRQWHPTPVLLPGKSHGWRSLVGCSPWGR